MKIKNFRLHQYLNQHPKIKQWIWFVALWLGGLLTVTAIAYPIKYIIRLSL